LVQGWTAFQQRIVAELIVTDPMLLFAHFEHLLSYEPIIYIVHCFKTTNVVEFL